jgi:hypothetical protein
MALMGFLKCKGRPR